MKNSIGKVEIYTNYIKYIFYVYVEIYVLCMNVCSVHSF